MLSYILLWVIDRFIVGEEYGILKAVNIHKHIASWSSMLILSLSTPLMAQFCILKNLCVRQIQVEQNGQGQALLLNLHSSPAPEKSFVTVNAFDYKQVVTHYDELLNFLNQQSLKKSTLDPRPEFSSESPEKVFSYPLNEPFPFHTIQKNCGGIEVNGDFLPHIRLSEDPSC